jgi:hypothetical protein
MNGVIAAIGTVWECQGIRNRSTASAADIILFQEKYCVKLPTIVRDYFYELNGTIGGQLGMDDENLIGFWHLDQVRPMKEECPTYIIADGPNLFIFADYSIWALGYAMRLVMEDEDETPIFLIGGGDRPLQIARTFEEFLRRYAVRDQGMLFGETNMSQT